MTSSLPVRSAFSAGGVVWRASDNGPEIIVCSRHSSRLRCLPKGTPEPGESPMTTALREVQEETGLEVIAGPEVGMIDYWFVRGGARIHKRVRWWLMEAVGGSVEMHDAEFDEVCWLPAAEAATILSYPDERGIVEKAMDIIDTRQPA